MLEALSWEVLSREVYSTELATSDFHLFASMSLALAEQRFGLYEVVKKWLGEWFASREEDFYRCVMHKLSER